MKNVVDFVAVVMSHNNVDAIDRTIASLREQNIPKERLYIVAVDFNSTDGTYEKLLAYDGYHLGVYKVTENVRREQYPYRCAPFVRKVATNDIKYYAYFHAGDTITPDFAPLCTELMERYKEISPTMVICEANIMDKAGKIVSQPPLFDTAHIIDGLAHPECYYERGYNHRVFTCGYPATEDISYRVNHDNTIFSNLFFGNYRRKAIYIPKAMATVTVLDSDNATFDIGTKYAMLLLYQRVTPYMYSDALDASEYDAAFKNLAEYALLIASREFQKGATKTAEDCLLLAEVICPDLVSEKIFNETSLFINGKGNEPKNKGEITLSLHQGSEIITAPECSILH